MIINTGSRTDIPAFFVNITLKEESKNRNFLEMSIRKSKSILMIFDRHSNLKYRYGNRHFWCRGYYVDTVGRNEKAIKEYVRNQLQEDIAADQISIKEFNDPFTGEPVVKGK